MKPVRIGVVGVGHMGRIHAGKVAELADHGGGVVLAGVVDDDPERAAAIAHPLGAPVATDSGSLFADADAVIVSVTTVAHHAVVSAALAAGLDVLVEKPIAATLEEAEDLVAIAQAAGQVLQVGHQEWFNPAMRAVQDHIASPRFAEIHRLGPFPERSTDVDVVRDLMIHDIEILQQLLGGEPERVDAVGVPVVTDHVDIANARLTFPGRCVANLTASRVSATPMRKLRLFQRDAYFSIDFLEQKAAMFRRLPDPDGGPPRIEMDERKGGFEDALRLQLEAFVAAIREREIGGTGRAGAGGVSGAEATSALRTAFRVIDAMPALDDLP